MKVLSERPHKLGYEESFFEGLLKMILHASANIYEQVTKCKIDIALKF